MFRKGELDQVRAPARLRAEGAAGAGDDVLGCVGPESGEGGLMTVTAGEIVLLPGAACAI